jgi:hypothetical protein
MEIGDKVQNKHTGTIATITKIDGNWVTIKMFGQDKEWNIKLFEQNWGEVSDNFESTIPGWGRDAAGVKKPRK